MAAAKGAKKKISGSDGYYQITTRIGLLLTIIKANNARPGD